MRVVRVLLLAAATVIAGCHGGSHQDGRQQPPVSAGLDARPSNTTCVAPSKAGGGATIDIEHAFPNLTFDQPLALLQAPGDDSRWYAVERTGTVRTFANTPTVATATPFITLTVDTSGEGGLLGMAFSPNYATNHEVYLSFTETGNPLVSVVARFTLAADGTTLDPASREDVIRLDQPYANHNGGNIAFGPDGDLYIGFGDGGSGDDPLGAGQNTENLLGSLLRLKIDGAAPYEIPADNPFATNAMCSADPGVAAGDCPEIYAWGLRNPWRWSFDAATGDLWVGDVGQNQWEEVDRVHVGGNYGWDVREGRHCHEPATGCSTSGLIDPVAEYDHSLGNSITGGYVYRGSALPALAGHYLFADYGSGRIWQLVDDGSGGFTAEQLLDTSLSVASFGQGSDGELYVVDIAGGGVYRIVDGGGAAAGVPVPRLLSATGCVTPQDPSVPAAGLVPYDVAAPFWSDGALKERWLAIPNGTSIAVGTDGDFAFPNGTVLMKHFRLNGRLIETRLFMRHPDGEWAGYSYEWNAEQTDATLVEGGKTVAIDGQGWIYPSGNDCLRCHTEAAGFALGLESAQLNHAFAYAATGRSANQLLTLDQVAMFTTPLGDAALQAKLADPEDASAPLDARTRAYLHTNCAQCHRPNGPTSVSLDLRYSTALAAMGACGATPQEGDLGIAGAKIIAPGDPDASVLLARLSRRDANAMPPLASNVVDADGATLIHDWIASLTGCM